MLQLVIVQVEHDSKSREVVGSQLNRGINSQTSLPANGTEVGADQ
jgi:secreted PhoX family phosphatase